MSRSTFITADGCALVYEDSEAGVPVLWQHGLGGDRKQPADVFPENSGLRRITLECRGHGESQLGEPARLSIAQFAEDALGLLDHLGVERAVIGGISMGAAIGLRLGVTHPERVDGLILARPAWVDEAAPVTMRPYLAVAQLLRVHGREEGLRQFEQSAELAEVDAVSPDNAASLRGFFSREDKAGTVELLSRIPKDGPGVSLLEIAAIKVPTAIIANGEDYVHPLRYAERLRELIPGAALRVITSKTVDAALYRLQFREALRLFLAFRFTESGAFSR
jgi:pimeloyl-ACP methyl ester carboxylesterase